MIVRFCQTQLSMATEAADEAAQVVLVKLLSNMREFKYDPRQSFRAWLRRVTRNSVIDAMRRKQPDRAVGGSDVMERLNNISADGSGHESLVEQLSLDLRRTLFSECEGLVKSRVTEQTWTAFSSLRDGERANDVAQSLGMTVAAVYRAKTRVLKLFREEVTLKLQARD